MMRNKSDNGLILSDVKITLKGRMLIDIEHLQVEKGLITAIMGPSGVGKSTLLAWLGGYIEDVFEASGKAFMDGVDILAKPAHQRKMGILFQESLLYPHMSVSGNLLFAMPPGHARKERQEIAEEALGEVGLEGYGTRHVDTLSGGQKARVALMRVLLSKPDALLLDEPFSKLDHNLRSQIRDLTFEKAVERKLPVLIVTHDADDTNHSGVATVQL